MEEEDDEDQGDQGSNLLDCLVQERFRIMFLTKIFPHVLGCSC